MEAFYRASALHDEEIWAGWDRLELLERAIDVQVDNNPGYRIYGSEENLQSRLSRSQRRLNLMERKIER